MAPSSTSGGGIERGAAHGSIPMAVPMRAPGTALSRPLLIGIGNRLCGDDGVGAQLVDALTAEGDGRLRTLTVHQLTPELAAVVADASAVLFVDACPGRRRPVLEVISAAGAGSGSFSHQLAGAAAGAVCGAVRHPATGLAAADPGRAAGAGRQPQPCQPHRPGRRAATAAPLAGPPCMSWR